MSCDLLISQSQPQAQYVPCRADILRLKRLQRDAFEQMLRLDVRLTDLEERSGEPSSESSSGVSALFGSSSGSARAYAGAERAPVQASGQLVYGASVPLPVRLWFSQPGEFVSHLVILRAWNDRMLIEALMIEAKCTRIADVAQLVHCW